MHTSDVAREERLKQNFPNFILFTCVFIFLLSVKCCLGDEYGNHLFAFNDAIVVNLVFTTGS